MQGWTARGCEAAWGRERRELAADEAREYELGNGRSTRALETRSLAVVSFGIGNVLGLDQTVSMLIPYRRGCFGSRHNDSMSTSVLNNLPGVIHLSVLNGLPIW